MFQSYLVDLEPEEHTVFADESVAVRHHRAISQTLTRLSAAHHIGHNLGLLRCT